MALICGVCFRKSSLKLLSISEAKLRLIRDYHYDLYDTNNLPKKLCKSCSSTLSDIEKKGPASSRKLPDTDYVSIIFPPRSTRSNESELCPCTFCGIGRMKAQPYLTYKETVRNKPGRPRETPVLENVKLCGNCQGVIHRGVSHLCNKTSKNSNLVEFVQQVSPVSQRRICSSLLDKGRFRKKKAKTKAFCLV